MENLTTQIIDIVKLEILNELNNLPTELLDFKAEIKDAFNLYLFDDLFCEGDRKSVV